MRLLYWAAAAGLLLPLLTVAATSLSDAPLTGLPGTRLTLHPYAVLLADPAWTGAFALSFLLALAAGAAAALLGTWAALALPTLPRPLRLLAGALVLLPLLTPGIVHALSLRVAASLAGLPPGPGLVLLGHAIHGTPFAALMAAARRATLPPALLDAARDLGATPAAAFRLVVLPWLRPALAAAAALAALASFDDFVRSFMLGGYRPTLPVLMFARTRAGATPEAAAAATLVVLVALAAGWAASRAPRPP